jgi:hypothetical protein
LHDFYLIVAMLFHFATRGISAQLIEKDYYVTEALRSFDYPSMFQGAETISLIAPQILLEMGMRSGNYPTQIVRLSSYLVDCNLDTNSYIKVF